MKTLEGRIAVVAGASRGAGRGIALGLGEAGATVYVVGRSTSGGWTPPDGAPETIEQTAEDVSERGGIGIAHRADCTVESDVAALFERVHREQGRLDVLANAVWGGADAFRTMKEWQQSWSQPFFAQPANLWDHLMGSVRAYLLTSMHGARLMEKKGGGLIVGVTDGILDGVAPDVMEGKASGDYQGQLLTDLAHVTINRMMLGMSVEARPYKIAVVTLMPGFMRTERVERHLTSEKLKKQFGYEKSESTLYIGRAVAALAGDAEVMEKSGRIHFVADLAREYEFTDADGRAIPRFNPFG